MAVGMGKRACLLAALLAGPSMGCLEPTAPQGELGSADLRVLFIGNSLTYTNDLPAIVQILAESMGRTMAYREQSYPNFSLEDHWATGVERLIEETRADWVVLQQGPSSLPENQIYLATWTAALAPAVRAAGGEPVLFMVWPENTRMEAFDAVLQSYRQAAIEVDGVFAPAGEAWREVWRADPSVRLYGGDGFHPSGLGSLVAAMTIYAVLSGDDVRDLPDVLQPTSPGLGTITLPPDTAALLRDAVHRTLLAWPARPQATPAG